MDTATLLLLLCSWQPGNHPPEFPYPQLPNEIVCELCYHQCESDRAAITSQLQVVGGWHRVELLELKAEADRLTAVWYATWWIVWSRANREQRDEWASILSTQVNSIDFWRGTIPLPLGCRQ